MPRITSLADVKVDLGEGVIGDSEEARVLKLIDRAEARIRQRVADPTELIASGRTDEVLVRQVVAEMVASVLRNPGAWQSSTESKTTGPYTRSESRTLNLAAASGLMRLTQDHLDLLGGTERTTPGPYSLELTAWDP